MTIQTKIIATARLAAQKINLKWRETNYLLLRRGKYVIASGLDESIAGEPRKLNGGFVNLFDPTLRVQDDISVTPGSRQFLLDLNAARTGKVQLLASACKALLVQHTRKEMTFATEGIDASPAIVLLESPQPPRTVTLDGTALSTFEYSAKDHLLWIHFENKAERQDLSVHF